MAMRLMLATIGVSFLAATTTTGQVTTSGPAPIEPYVSTAYPYNGPAVPIGQYNNAFTDPIYPPAVAGSATATNNINVIALSYVPTGMNVHFSTPFALSTVATVNWGTSATSLTGTATGTSQTYARTPACNATTVLSCNQFFHNVQITGLAPKTTYYYSIAADPSGSVASPAQAFTTAQAAGDATPFNITMLADLGYTFANATLALLLKQAAQSAFVSHAGDISYADNFLTGGLEQIYLNIAAGQSVTQAVANAVAQYPQGGDISYIYESNWDEWQQWMSPLTKTKPYMTIAGNHEASCAEGDGAPYVITEYLNHNVPNTSDPNGSTYDKLNYYSCPPSTRNFTAYANRFRMPSVESTKTNNANMWWSMDIGLVHFVALDSETDYPMSQELPFSSQVTSNGAAINATQSNPISAGPFGYVGTQTSIVGWQQLDWLQADLAAVNRTKTPWIIVQSHRPLYSASANPSPGGSPTSYFYQVRNAFEPILLKYGVDLWLAGHIHWYERMFPMANTVIDKSAIINNNTFISTGKSITTLVIGNAGNSENHSTCSGTSVCNTTSTAYLDTTNFGFGQFTVMNSTALYWQQFHAVDGSVGDTMYLLKPSS